MSKFGGFPAPATNKKRDDVKPDGDQQRERVPIHQASSNPATKQGVKPSPFSLPTNLKAPKAAPVLDEDPGTVDERVARRMAEIASWPADKQVRYDAMAARLIAEKADAVDIEKVAAMFDATREELIALQWFEPDGSFGRRSFVRRDFIFEDLPVLLAMREARLQREAKTANPVAPAPRKTSVLSADPNSIVDPAVLAGLSSSGPIKDRYAGPAAERVAFLHKVAASKGQQLTALDPLAAVSTSARPGHEHVTVTGSKYDQYFDIGRRFDVAYREEIGIPLDFSIQINLADFSAWIQVLRKERDWTSSTWRLYRAAISMWVRDTYEESELEDFLISSADIYGAFDAHEHKASPSLEAEVPRKGEKRTSAKKNKFFKREHFLRVCFYLERRSRSPRARLLFNWLIAGVYTGLRPIEWRATSIEEGVGEATGERYCWLYVLNGKATNGRGNGVVRTLDISGVEPHVLEAIKYMSDVGFEAFQKGADAYAEMQLACAKLLTKTCEAVFQRQGFRYSLYSCRHQFIANCKAKYLEIEEISAMAGHKDVTVAMSAYGRRQYGWPVESLTAMPSPSPQDVNLIRRYMAANDKYQKRYKGFVGPRSFGLSPELLEDYDV